jgi:hypothetical protein
MTAKMQAAAPVAITSHMNGSINFCLALSFMPSKRASPPGPRRQYCEPHAIGREEKRC